MVLRACHVDVLRTAEANADTLAADGSGNEACREAQLHRESREDRLGSWPKCLDLQALRH